ncbi:lysine exporter LysO family protein, partial [Serratia nevei]
LLLLVGIQLRNSGMTLRQIVLNRRGTLVALVVTVASLAGGALAAQLLGLPVKAGLAMASGFGWYSLSGILITDAYGPVMGSAAFFNDLARELVAIMLIPTLVRRSRSTALGLCGATSMDFTLPVLQRSGGLDMVPPAIVHGFLLSLLAPVLIALFS